MSKAFITLNKEGVQTNIQTRQHIYHADEPLEDGGTDEMVTPMEMLLGSLGSCIAITMRLYAERKQWALESVEIELEVEKFNANDYPEYHGTERFIHEIRKKIKLLGPLTEEQRQRILEIGGKCPVHRVLTTPTFFTETLVENEEPFEAVAK
jgi:putative redox protein